MQVQIQNLRLTDQKSIKAFFTLHILDLGISIKDCKYILTKDGKTHFIGFPSIKEPSGAYTNLINWVKDSQNANDFQDSIITEIEEEINNQL